MKFKKQKAKSVILKIAILMVLFGTSPLTVAVAETYGDYEYQIVENGTPIESGVEIIGYTGGGGDVVIPEAIGYRAVKSIGGASNFTDGVFYKRGITSIHFPEYLTNIGENAFYGNELYEVVIPDSVDIIGKGAFAFNKIEDVTIESGVTTLSYGAFGYNRLKNVTIPDSVTSIGNFAFQANQLENVTIGNGVVSIEHGAFESNQLTSVIISDSVTSIATMAFARNQITMAVIPDNVTSIGFNAFDENQEVPANLTIYGVAGSAAETFANDRGYSFNELLNTEYSFTLINDGTEAEITGYTGTGGDVAIPGEIFVPGVSEGYPVTSIGRYAFRSKPLTSVAIPDSVTVIGQGALASNQLTSVTFGESLTTIGSSAFEFNQLVSITIPDSVTSIGSGAFMSNELTSIVIGDSVGSIGNAAFIDNQLTIVTIPESVNSIGNSAFSENNLSTVKVPKSVTSIQTDAFSQNQPITADLIIYGEVDSEAESLAEDNGYTFKDLLTSYYEYELINNGTEVEITGYAGPGGDVVIPTSLEGKDVTSIKGESYYKNGAFYDSAITSIELPDTLINIGENAFYGNNLTDVVVPDNVTSIGKGVFAFNQLDDATIGNGVEIIGYGAFGQNRIKSIVFPDSVTEIGNFAFQANQLKSVTIGNNVVSIGHGAFESNQLTSVVIQKTATAIDSGAFNMNQDVPADLIIYGTVDSAAEKLAWENGYTFKVLVSIDYIAVVGEGGKETVDISEGTIQMIAHVMPKTGTYEEVTWSVISGTGDATIDQTGLLSVVKDGTVSVVATTKDGSGVEGVMELAITDKGIRITEFNDMKETDWFHDTVTELVTIGGITGYPDNTFKPMETMKKGEFIKLIVSGLGYSQTNSDVGHWAMNYVTKAESLGILDSQEFPYYSLNDDITRNEMAKMAVRSIDIGGHVYPENLDYYKPFIDDYDSTSPEYQEYVLKAYASGILTGYPDGEFKGDKTLNRAEAATVALRVLVPEQRVKMQ